MALQLFVAIRFFTTPEAFADPSLNWTWVLHRRRIGFGAPLFGLAVWLVVALPRLPRHWRDLIATAGRRRLALPLLAQSLACLACYALAWPLYHRPLALGSWGWPLLLAWMAAVASCGLLSLWLLAPVRYWRALLREEWRASCAAVAGMLAGGALITLLEQAWTRLPLLARLTLGWSAWLLRQIYPDAIADPATAVLGTATFRVLITDACSGYLGVSLTLGLMACYCYVFRAEIRWWVMLVLLPLAVVVSLALNVLRIVALVVLGVEVSPQVAINGFHTNAGSIAMVLGCAALIGLVHRFVVSRGDAEPIERLGWTLDLESALLVPIMVLLAATLLTGAASGSFIWLYPLRVLAVALALVLCWPHLRPLLAWPGWSPLLIGAAVFGLWLALVDAQPEADRAFAAALATAPPGLALVWLVLRVIGAAVTVPIAEELAFRGYLLTVLSRRPVQAGQPLPFDWLGFAGSSLLFGALHGQWLAGTLAGAAYAGARYRRDRLWDAVVAHMTTNLLLAIHVLATGRWSYW